jgi:hypothetical protein
MLLAFSIKFGKFALGTVDSIFLILLLVCIALIVLIYFSNPIINHKKFKHDREELAQREKLYHDNKGNE